LQANRRLEVALAENAGLQRQLLTQACEAGVLDERQRLAREIHDTSAACSPRRATQVTMNFLVYSPVAASAVGMHEDLELHEQLGPSRTDSLTG
jgi:hypothetical protein